MNLNNKIDNYIEAQPANVKKHLEELRKFIHSVVPDAEEVFSYQIPCYKYHGMLVGFGVNSKGCSFYTTNTKLLPQMDPVELRDVKYSGSTIHFSPERPLPFKLIEKIIRIRMLENEMRALKKTQILTEN